MLSVKDPIPNFADLQLQQVYEGGFGSNIGEGLANDARPAKRPRTLDLNGNNRITNLGQRTMDRIFCVLGGPEPHELIQLPQIAKYAEQPLSNCEMLM